MPNWRKIITSGSDASLNTLVVTNGITVTGSIFVTQSHISTVDYIDYVINPPTPAHLEGRTHWDQDRKTLQIDTDVNNFVISAGHMTVLRGRNTNSFTLTKGTVVYVNGNSGQFATFGTASWENDANSAYTIGIISQDINSNQFGYAVTDGEITDINTNGFSPATLLYLSSSGQYTDVKPTAPNHTVRLGQVVVSSTSGIIQVKIDNGYELGELHDVLDTTTTSSYGDLLVKSGSLWINSKQLTGSYGLTGSLQATSFTGSLLGTASYATQALSSSFATTASYILNAVSSSFATTASYALNALSASFAPVFPYTGSALITGSLGVTGSANVTTMGIGAIGSTSIPLDVRAQGALASNNVFRVRNSADAVNLFAQQGDGTFTFRNNGNTDYFYWAGSNTLELGNSSGTYKTLIVGGQYPYLGTNGGSTVGARTGNNAFTIWDNSNFVFGANSGIQQGSGKYNILIQSGSAPTTNITDHFYIYAADRNGTAGKASPHFRTEDGTVVWLGDESRLFNVTASNISASSLTANTTLIGSSAPTLNATAINTLTNSGSFTVYNIPTASYDGAFFEYVAKSGSNARAGNIMATYIGTTASFTETTTTDIGSTTGLNFTVFVTGSNLVLTGSVTTPTWTIKTIVRLI